MTSLQFTEYDVEADNLPKTAELIIKNKKQIIVQSGDLPFGEESGEDSDDEPLEAPTIFQRLRKFLGFKVDRGNLQNRNPTLESLHSKMQKTVLCAGVDVMFDEIFSRDMLKQVLQDRGFGIRITVGDLVISMKQLRNSLSTLRDLDGLIVCILTFITQLTSKTYTQVLDTYGRLIVKMFITLFYEFRDFISNNGNNFFRTQSKTIGSIRAFIKDVRECMSTPKKYAKTIFAKKLITFGSLVLCTPLFVKKGWDVTLFGFDAIVQKSLMKEYRMLHPTMMAFEILDHSLYLIDKFLDVVDSGDLNVLLVDDELLSKFEVEYNFVLTYEKKLNLLENHSMSLDGYYRLCDKLLKQMQEFKRMYDFDQTEYAYFDYKSRIQTLRRCMYAADDRLKTRIERDPPIAICMVGPPDIGKSNIMLLLCKILYDNAQTLGRDESEFSKDKIYTYNYSEEFMTGFRISHEVLRMDDLGMFKQKIVEHQGGGAILHTIDFINPVPYTTNQAALEEKGMIPFLCKYVVATSNFHDACMGHVFQGGGGAWRRFLFLDSEVRPEFCKPGETALAGDPKGINYEMHTFIPRKYMSVGGTVQEVRWDHDLKEWVKYIPRRMTMLEVQIFLREEIQAKHYNSCDKARSTANNFIASGRCAECGNTAALCGHFQTQAGLFTNARLYYERLHAQRAEKDAHIRCNNPNPNSGNSVMLSYWNVVRCKALKLSWRNVFGIAQFIGYLCLGFIAEWLDFATWTSRIIYFGLSPPVLLGSFISQRMTEAYFHLIAYCIPFMGFWWLSMLILPVGLFRIYHFLMICRSYSMFYLYPSAGKYMLRVYVARHRAKLRGIAYVGGLYMMYKTISSFAAAKDLFDDASEETKEDVSEEEEEFSDILPQGGETEVAEYVAKKDSWTVKYEELSVLKGPKSTITEEQLINAMERNVIRLEYNSDKLTKLAITHLFGVYGNVAFVNRHFYNKIFDSLPGQVDFIRCEDNMVCGPTKTKIFIDKKNFHDIFPKERDIIIFQHPSLGTFRDIRKFLNEGHLTGKSKGFILTRDMTGKLVRNEIRGVHAQLLVYKDMTNLSEYKYIGYTACPDARTEDGQCGGPYVLNGQNGLAIAGIHCGAHFDDVVLSFCAPIFNGDASQFPSPNSYNGLELNSTYEGMNVSIIQSMHKNDPLAMLDEASAFFYGTVSVPRARFTSNVQPTIMAEDVLRHYELDGFSHFSPRQVNGRMAIYNNIVAMVDKPSFPPALLDQMVRGLTKYYVGVVKTLKLEVPNKPYGIDVAINGLDGVPYVNRIPGKTSGGFGHRGRKDKYFVELESEEDHLRNFGLNEDLMKEFERMKATMASGERPGIIWDCVLKDEPISAAKVLANKVRMFSSGPLCFILLERAYFLWCIPLLSGRLRHRFGCAIGADACGEDWSELYHYITRFGTHRVFDGDYSLFDKKQSEQVIWAAFEVLIGLAREVGFNEEDLQMMRAIATEVTYPTMNVFGFITEFYGSNPSGHSLTTIINCITNILYMMMASKTISDELGKDEIDYENFFDTLSLLTYGDDNIASSRLDYINHTTISNALAKYGITYTMADKYMVSKPFKDISECSFLKRQFVVGTHRLENVAAPLEEASIIKSLSIITVSKSITREEQCAMIIDAAAREYFQYGVKKFAKKMKFLNELLDKHNLRPYLPGYKLKTYDELYAQRFGMDFSKSVSDHGVDNMCMIVQHKTDKEKLER